MTTMRDSLLNYLRNKVRAGSMYYSNHELIRARSYISMRFGRSFNVPSLERRWRELKSKGLVQVEDATPPGSKEKRWKIIRVHGAST